MSRKLTKDFLRSRLGTDEFENIKNVNLWGNNIDDISLLSEMPLLEIISLSVNHIKDLSVFLKLKNVKELYLKDNKISDFNQIENLKNCSKLQVLCLQDNPISKQPNYSQKIFEILPNLKKLDDLDNNNSEINKNLPPSNVAHPQSSFILFKKIFPQRGSKFRNKIIDLNTSENEQIKNKITSNNIKEEKNKNEKTDLLNISFQKKRTLGTFRKVGNKRNTMNLDLSVDYAKGDDILLNNNEINDPNRSTYINDYKHKNIDINSARNKYNRKVIGNFKKEQIKNYQSTMLTYQEFDAPIKKEEHKKNLYDNNKNFNNIGNSIIKSNKNENIVLQSIRILLDTLSLSELKVVNDDIQKIIKDKNK